MPLADRVTCRFIKELNSMLAHHEELKLAIHNKRNEASLQSELVIQFVLQAAVLWESFLNDLILAYAEMSPRKAISSLEARIKQSVESKFGRSSRRAIKFTPKRTMTRKALVGLLDHRGWNIAFKDSNSLASRANDLLVSRHAKKFSLESQDAEFVDYVVRIRNFLSHNSAGARSDFKQKTGALSAPDNRPLKGPVRQIGNYLRADGGNGTSRAVFIVRRLKDVAEKL